MKTHPTKPHRAGFAVPKKYVFNRFHGMVARGMMVRGETGRYRIVRAYPKVVES